MSLPPFPIIRPSDVHRMAPLTAQGFRTWLAIEMAAAACRHQKILRHRAEHPMVPEDPDAAEHRAAHEALTQRERDARRLRAQTTATGLRKAS
jgi:hypothetical protein